MIDSFSIGGRVYQKISFPLLSTDYSNTSSPIEVFNREIHCTNNTFVLCYTAISTANIPRPPYLVYSICSITIIAFLLSYSCFFLNFLINYIIGYFSVAFICFDFAIKSSYGSSNFFSNYNTWTSLSFLRTDYFLSIHLLLIFSSSIFFQPTLVCRTSFFLFGLPSWIFEFNLVLHMYYSLYLN